MTAGDIARLVDVGRAAVSNWRRRHEDFPRPVGGTASSPLFSLGEVEDWLRRNGKTFRVGTAERAWQRLRAAGDDLLLGARVAAAGAVLAPDTDLPGDPDPGLLDAPARRSLTELAAELGAAEAFEFVCARYREAHSRTLGTTPPAVAALLADLACRPGDTVLDPACGLGTLPLAAPAGRVLAQELDPAAAAIAAARLALAGVPGEVVSGDSLRHDGLAGHPADAVVCDPPFNERAWGYPELTGDPRWTYGLPPRGEPELAWAQHCLAHVRPGGTVALLMPPAAANRRPGRRIRANLLRAGVLRGVVSLPGGLPDVWLLRGPAPGERPPAHLLLLVADDLAEVAPAWRRHLRRARPGPAAVPVIDLLDDDVDVGPARWASRGDVAAEFARTLARFRAVSAVPPALDPTGERPAPPATTVADLARDGLVSIRSAPSRMALGAGDVPVLLADDVAEGRPPSAHTEPGPALVDLAPGDVVATPAGATRVVGEPGAVAGPNLTRYRPAADRLDPDFLAGYLRAATMRSHAASSRIDARRAPIPPLPMDRQRAYGAAFRELARLSDDVREAAGLGENLVRLGFEGLTGGQLRPGGTAG